MENSCTVNPAGDEWRESMIKDSEVFFSHCKVRYILERVYARVKGKSK